MKNKKWNVDSTGKWPFTQYIMDGEVTVAQLEMYHYSSTDKTISDVLKRDKRNIEVVGNAKLIAAAPELLANLTRIIDRIEECEFQGSFPSAYRRAKEVIKKTIE